ncbi:hypothetical protein C1646_762971 [Rhizophagus diaphanus]|nr:hypothetical protein C1646_762971 [Rhizophagus diaphanus] [Rhizophagus sp. MUCL 43196]
MSNFAINVDNVDDIDDVDDVNESLNIKDKLKECEFQCYEDANSENDKNFLNIYKKIEETVKKLQDKRKVVSMRNMRKLIQSKNNDSVYNFLNSQLKKCIAENKVEHMLIVAVSLPHLVDNFYESPVARLMKQLTYIKVPQNLYGYSTHENLWSHKYPADNNGEDKWFKRLLKWFIPMTWHSATLCYVPLPGLCTYPESVNWFPRDLSPFAKLTTSYPCELLPSRASYEEMFKSPPFQAIVKFKWHAFGIITYNQSTKQLRPIAIVLIWLDLIRYLIVFKRIAIIFFVIVNVVRKIVWLLVFTLIIMIGSAHSFMITAKEYDNDNNFKTLVQSFNNVWSWFLNDYDSMQSWMGIAIVNNAYEKIIERANYEWCWLRAHFMVMVELLLMAPSERQNRNYFPWIVIYEAFTEEVEKWPQNPGCTPP